MNEAQIIELIASLTQQGYYVLTAHATQRRIERKMSIMDVEKILLHPKRVVREDELQGGKIRYKIRGGQKKRSLAVLIEDNCVVVLTVM